MWTAQEANAASPHSVGTIRSAGEPRMCVADHEASVGSTNRRGARCLRFAASARSLHQQPGRQWDYRSSSETVVDSVGFVVREGEGTAGAPSRYPVRAARSATYRISYLVS